MNADQMLDQAVARLNSFQEGRVFTFQSLFSREDWEHTPSPVRASLDAVFQEFASTSPDMIELIETPKGERQRFKWLGGEKPEEQSPLSEEEAAIEAARSYLAREPGERTFASGEAMPETTSRQVLIWGFHNGVSRALLKKGLVNGGFSEEAAESAVRVLESEGLRWDRQAALEARLYVEEGVSLIGLKEALEKAEFGFDDIRYALMDVDTSHLDWKEQAAKRASRIVKGAQTYSPFTTRPCLSKDALAQQLAKEHFDKSQITYAMRKLKSSGVDWNAQALEWAHGFIEGRPISESVLRNHLKNAGCTRSQIRFVLSRLRSEGIAWEEQAVSWVVKFASGAPISADSIRSKLEEAGFTPTQANRAVNYASGHGVDWNEQAFRHAEQFINSERGSEEHLTQSMLEAGFTPAEIESAHERLRMLNQEAVQAAHEKSMERSCTPRSLRRYLETTREFGLPQVEYALEHLDVDWKKKAVSNVEDFAFSHASWSKQVCIESMKNSGFDDDQIDYAMAAANVNWLKSARRRCKELLRDEKTVEEIYGIMDEEGFGYDQIEFAVSEPTTMAEKALQKATYLLAGNPYSAAELKAQLGGPGRYGPDQVAYVMDHLEVNWSIQAFRKACRHLEFYKTLRSKQRLAGYLLHDGFTQEEVNAAIALLRMDWNQEALKFALRNIDEESLSASEVQKLLEQYKYEAPEIEYVMKNLDVDWLSVAAERGRILIEEWPNMSEDMLADKMEKAGFTAEEIQFAEEQVYAIGENPDYYDEYEWQGELPPEGEEEYWEEHDQY